MSQTRKGKPLPRKAPRPRTKLRVFVRHGNADPKEVTPPPKDWTRRKSTEGRERKEKRAKNIKLKEILYPVTTLASLFITEKVGLPDCKWMITCAKPARRLTARDVLLVIHDAHLDRMRMPDDKKTILVEVNEYHHVLNIQDLSEILPLKQEEELASTICDA